jgi:LPS export ABC transporter protein LptC
MINKIDRENRKAAPSNWRLLSNVCCLLSVFLFSCENSDKALQEWSQDKALTEEAININTLFSQGGRVKANLTAPLMLREQADSVFVEFPKTLHVDFYDSTGKQESQLDALYGKYFETAGKVFLRDSVVVATVRGDTLRAPELWWDQNKGKFYTDKLVRIKQADKQIYGGRGFEAEQDLSTYTIFENTGVVRAPEGM